MAIKYFEEKKYEKCDALLDQLLPMSKGTADAEIIYYYYCKTQFAMKNYIMAAYHCKNFTNVYPSSSNAEEMDFLQAYSAFKESADYELDQTGTAKAMESIQLFVNHHPESPRISECNDMMDQLRKKLEYKAIQAADLFFNMEDYRAAATAYMNVLKDFPDVSDKEYIRFKIVQAYVLWAQNSIESKKQERYELANEAYKKYMEDFSAGLHFKQVTSMGETIQKAISSLSTSK